MFFFFTKPSANELGNEIKPRSDLIIAFVIVDMFVHSLNKNSKTLCTMFVDTLRCKKFVYVESRRYLLKSIIA